MRSLRGVWVGTVLLGAAAACSSGDTTSFSGEEGGVPHYDSGAPDATGSSGGPGSDAASSSADGGQEAAQPEASAEAAADAPGPDAPLDSAADAGVDAPEEAAPEAGAEAGSETEAGPEPEPEAGVDAANEAAPDAPAEAATDAPAEATTDAAQDAGSDAPGIVAPTCDGVIGAGEYGGTGNQLATGSGQTWYATWDDTNLYLAISNANVAEGDIVYLAVDPGSDAGPAGGATSGRLYDSTDITLLPFAAQLVAYAHDGYTEARAASGGAWGSHDTTSVRLCDDAAAQVREEVIPWSLVGGRPESFGWFGYLAANGNQNPNGYIYGQVPQDDPGGGPANAEVYTHYFVVPDATPWGGLPFAHER
jgi:hypothetical protein